NLETLIASWVVCSDWHQLVPLADIYPPRRCLFNLYRHMVNNPKPDKEAQAYYRKNLNHRFDREAYINCLLNQHPIILEEFRIWVLEWPARCVMRWLELYVPGQIPPVQYRGFEDDVTLWDCNIWMVFSKKSPLFGKVLEVRNGLFPTTDESMGWDATLWGEFSWVDHREDDGKIMRNARCGWLFDVFSRDSIPQKAKLSIDMKNVEYSKSQVLGTQPGDSWTRRMNDVPD
ncbi:hypothetical protein CPB84DRAFT_1893792, partial [Gymnopilus junonius]